MKTKTTLATIAWVTALLLGLSATAQDDATELAKKSQNPIADLISVPIMNNVNFDAGPDDHVQNTMNIQPVVPSSLGEDWLLINRVIFPLVNDWYDGDTWGLGDIQYQGYFSPKAASTLTWGIGPVLQFPSATDDLLGTEQWVAGAGAVAVKTQGKWVYGGLINNSWSFAGDDDREDVNLMFIQPFVNYNLGQGLAVGSVPQISANWEAAGSDVWTVPLGMQISKVKPIGTLPINWTLGGYYNAAKAEYGADWTLRLQATIMFPK